MRIGLSLAILLACSGAASAQGEDAREKEVREQLERELNSEVEAMVKTPPPSMELFFDGLSSPRYELLEAAFTLDGSPLPFKSGDARSQSLFFGILAPGAHTVTAQLVYREKPSSVFTYASLKYRLPGRYTVPAQRGLHLRMRLKVEADDGAEPAKRLQLQAALEADMMVDASERPPKAPVAAGIAPDAGVAPVVAVAAPAAAAPDASTPAPAAALPQKKRIRRHLKNLLQNLARSTREGSEDAETRMQSLRQNLARKTKEDAAAELPPGEWIEEEVPEKPLPSKPSNGG